MNILLLVEAGHPIGGIKDVEQWPWTWHRFISYCRTVKSIYERVGMDEDSKTAVPPKWMWWEPDDLDDWFKERQEAARERHKDSS